MIVGLQGAARMVLQGGTHPAQLKDSVTSKRHHLYFEDFADGGQCSTGRVHDRRFAGIGRRKSSIDNRKRDTNCHRAS